MFVSNIQFLTLLSPYFAWKPQKANTVLNICIIWTGHFGTKVINVHDFEQSQTACRPTYVLGGDA